MRWVLVIAGGIIGAALLLTFLPHGQQIFSPRGPEFRDCYLTILNPDLAFHSGPHFPHHLDHQRQRLHR